MQVFLKKKKERKVGVGKREDDGWSPEPGSGANKFAGLIDQTRLSNCRSEKVATRAKQGVTTCLSDQDPANQHSFIGQNVSAGTLYSCENKRRHQVYRCSVQYNVSTVPDSALCMCMCLYYTIVYTTSSSSSPPTVGCTGGHLGRSEHEIDNRILVPIHIRILPLR
jgi:hypothetical protein